MSHVAVDAAGVHAVELLHRSTALSRQEIKRAMTSGAVWLTRGRHTQRLRRAKRKLLVGDELHLYYDAKILAEIPAEPELVADVGDYSVWHKPFGLWSQGSKWGDHCTLVRWAERHLQPERSALTVHRLDRAASGLMLLAHSKRTAATLSRLFRERLVEKRYLAIVEGDFAATPVPLRVDDPVDGKAAASEFARLDRNSDKTRSLVDVRIETGRKHQVRRHLAGLGHPVVGDRLYGTADEGSEDLKLQAVKLAFECPVTGQRVDYALPPTERLSLATTQKD